MVIKIDYCEISLQNGFKYYGAVERVYPIKEWEIVETLGNTWGNPPQGFVEKNEGKAEVVAYGGDGVWFALKRRERK